MGTSLHKARGDSNKMVWSETRLKALPSVRHRKGTMRQTHYFHVQVPVWPDRGRGHAVEGGGGAAWWEGPGVWATRLCIMTPLLGTWAPLESSFKWTVLISVSQVHVATHRRDTAPGTRPWGGGLPHSNTWCSGPGAPQCQWLCPAALDALPCASVMPTVRRTAPDTCVLHAL